MLNMSSIGNGLISKNKNIISLIKKLSDEIDGLDLDLISLEFDATSINEENMKIDLPIDLAPYIEHTSLKPDVTKDKIVKLCDEAKKFHFLGVCVNPYFVKEAVNQLHKSNCLVISVVGFPLGANLTVTKVDETKQILKNGADEIDMVISLSALKDGDYKFVYHDIKSVVDAAKPAPVKVIIETGLLEKNELIIASLLALWAGASFVKTSTGFAYMRFSDGYKIRGATIEDIQLIKSVVGNKIGIKASGGIMDYKSAMAMMEAGATRLGSSASVSIITESECLFGHQTSFKCIL